MNDLLESFLENKFVKAVKKIGGLAVKFESPGMAGVPDRIVLLPGGKVLFVELKRPGQKPRPLQVKRIKDLEAMGFQVEVVDSVQRITEVCIEIEKILNAGEILD